MRLLAVAVAALLTILVADAVAQNVNDACRLMGTCGYKAAAPPPAPAATEPKHDEPPPSEKQAKFEALDPSADYAGKQCSYFTQPAVRADGSGTNMYSNGEWIRYGAHTYHCEDRYWVERESDSPVRNAEDVERSRFNRHIYGQ